MSYTVEKVYTDNPYVDELVYFTKTLAAGTVLKNEQKAIENETLESKKAADLYISCVDGTVVFELFSSYSRSSLVSAGLPEVTIVASLLDPENIPVASRDTVLSYESAKYIDEYEDLNDYYRMLNGLPDLDADPLYVTDWEAPSGVIIDLTVPIHEMDDDAISILETYDVISDLYDEDPTNRAYLNYLGDKKITPYIARKAAKFDLLYVPSIDNDTVLKDYKDKIDLNRLFILRTVYSEAYAYDSDYYDSFISVFIIIISMIDIISRVQEYIARKEIFDLRSIKYLFESYGVTYFDDIPLKYQIKMIKNIHTLLKYKSTSTCMVDICSLFGYDNVQIFKYYLLKDRKTDTLTGNYVFATTETTDDEGNTVIEEDYDQNYELKFVKAPIDGNIDEYIRSTTNYIDYDEITESDSSWDGGLDHDEVKLAIMKKEFNYTRSKYISIDSIYDITKLSFQQSYFFGMLFDNVLVEDYITISVPYIDSSHAFKVSDIFTFLTTLSYSYQGLSDIICDTQSKILHINGFNFKADLSTLAAYMAQYGTTASRAAYNSFITPTTSIPSFKQLMKIFVNNLEVRDTLIEGMYNADNLKTYNVFKTLYDSLMTLEYNFDYYKDSDTGDFYRDDNGDATFTEFLKYRDSYLYAVLLEIDSFEDEDARLQYIATIIDNVVYALEEYIDTDEYSGLFNTLPAMSSEAVKQYVAEVINFFKSYKVDFLGINTIYYIDDKLDGVIKLIDGITVCPYLDKNEVLKVYDIIRMTSTLTKQEQLALLEKMYFDISTWTYMHPVDESITLTMSAVDTVFSYIKSEIVTFTEKLLADVSMSKYDRVELGDDPDNFIATINTIKSDVTGIYDLLWVVESFADSDPDFYASIMSMLVDGVLNGETTQVVTEQGINLVDKDKFTDNTYIKSTGLTGSATTLFASDYTPVIGGEAIFIDAGALSATVCHAFYDSSKTFISAVTANEDGAITVPADAAYFRASFYKSAWTYDTAIVNYGSELADYEEFIPDSPSPDYPSDLINTIDGETTYRYQTDSTWYSVTIPEMHSAGDVTDTYDAMDGCGKNLSAVETAADCGWSTDSHIDLLAVLNALSAGMYTISCIFTLTSITDDTRTEYLYGIELDTASTSYSRQDAYGDTPPTAGDEVSYALTFTITADDAGNFTDFLIYGCGDNTSGVSGYANVTYIQIEEAEAATTWEPYRQQGTLVSNTGVKIFDGTETINTNSNGDVIFYTYEPSPIKVLSNGFCTHFNESDILSINSEEGFSCNSDATEIRFRPNLDLYPDVDTFKTWLAEQYAAGTPVTVYYKLAIPTAQIVEATLIE